MNENKTGKEIWSFNSEDLPNGRSATFDSAEIRTDFFIAQKEGAPSKVESLAEKTLTVRYVSFCVIFTLIGVLFAFLMRKFSLADNVERTALLHFPEGAISPYAFGIRIFFSKLPTVILLMLAGFTYFSGALTSLLIALNSLATGVGVSALLMLSKSLKEVGISTAEISVYTAWAFFSLALLVLLALVSRRTATKLHRKEIASREENRSFNLALARKYALLLALYIVLCITYTIALTVFS